MAQSGSGHLLGVQGIACSNHAASTNFIERIIMPVSQEEILKALENMSAVEVNDLKKAFVSGIMKTIEAVEAEPLVLILTKESGYKEQPKE